MDAELTKAFAFSASYSSGGRALGRNYTLLVTVGCLKETEERELEAIVRSELIDQVHTRDLSEQVEFLRNIEIDDVALLRAFWGRLKKPLTRFGPRRLALQRDPRTVTTLQL